MLTPYFEQNICLGEKHTGNFNLVFCGTRHTTKEKLIELYPEFQFRFVKQTHSAKCVESSVDMVEADAHWTDARNTALCIQTADCVPVLAYFPMRDEVLAIHAGWRGLESNIISESFARYSEAERISSEIWIGPHIRTESFEVHNDVADKLEQNYRKHLAKLSLALTLIGSPLGTDLPKSICFQHKDKDKKYVDLTSLTRVQLLALNCDPRHIAISAVDTFQHPDYHSFRREKSPGRQWSFIVRV